jgi:hypothetical protein
MLDFSITLATTPHAARKAAGSATARHVQAPAQKLVQGHVADSDLIVLRQGFGANFRRRVKVANMSGRRSTKIDQHDPPVDELRQFAHCRASGRMSMEVLLSRTFVCQCGSLVKPTTRQYDGRNDIPSFAETDLRRDGQDMT